MLVWRWRIDSGSRIDFGYIFSCLVSCWRRIQNWFWVESTLSSFCVGSKILYWILLLTWFYDKTFKHKSHDFKINFNQNQFYKINSIQNQFCQHPSKHTKFNQNQFHSKLILQMSNNCTNSQLQQNNRHGITIDRWSFHNMRDW